MENKDELLRVGKYNKELNSILDIKYWRTGNIPLKRLANSYGEKKTL